MKKNKVFFKSITFLSLLIFSASPLFAMDNYPFSAGLSIAGKMGINTSDTPEGWKNAISVLGSVDVAAMCYLPLDNRTKTGLFVEVGYTNTPFGLTEYSFNETGYFNQKYLTISPIVLMSGFTFGLEFGFAGVFENTVEKLPASVLPPINNEFIANLRVGGMIPLYTNYVGTFNFIINATYSITGTGDNGNYTYNPVTLSAGFNYMFNLEGDSDY